jgi:hypothetical protein
MMVTGTEMFMFLQNLRKMHGLSTPESTDMHDAMNVIAGRDLAPPRSA